MNELVSFFDNEQVVCKIRRLWNDFNSKAYEQDQIELHGQVGKISRKSGKVKLIDLEIGIENLYYFKGEGKEAKGQIPLSVVRFINGNKLIRNQQYVQLQLDGTWQSAFERKCLMINFHEEYQVQKMIGKGSFAKVYLANKKSNGEAFAIKAFNKEFMLEQFKGKDSLENEIRVMRRLNQSHLVKLYETYETQNSIYFVLDALKGGELLGRVKNQALSTTDLQVLMYNLMKGLAHLHSRKCMHRDLKPENLLLKSRESATDIVIADFGLATFTNEEVLFKRCGTPGFVAPEILLWKEGDPFYDEKCDVFSAGIIFYLLLTGKQPFNGADYKAILRANKNCEILYNLKQILTAPASLQDLLKKMLVPEPKNRITSEQCLKHPYFSDIFKQEDLMNSENLANYEKEYVCGLLKKSDSIMSTQDLTQRQPAMNGKYDTIGSFSNCSGSMNKFEQPIQKQVQHSKFSNFANAVKQSQDSSPQYKKNNQSDLHRQALKNNFQKNLQSKDDDYINEEEGAKLEDAITRLNSQSPKMGIKKANSFKVTSNKQPL